MKKELLIASALTASLGMAGVAEAATASFSGNVRNGVSGSDTDGTADGTYGSDQKASLSFSVSETTDAGVKVSTGFNVQDEGTNDLGDANGLTFTFTDGSKIDVIEAGNAYATHIASVPGASGEQGLTGTTSNSAPTGLNFADTSDNVGFEWHSAADAFGIAGLKAGVSAAFGDDGDTGSTSTAETSFSVGVNYVTTAGDTTVTIGGGYLQADDSNATTTNDKADESAIALTAATGDLTVGVGYASGSMVASDSASASEVDSAEVLTAGAKYVSGDITFAVGIVDGEAKDTTTFGDQGSTTDAYESMSASIDYVVASGVTATLGYTSEESAEESNSDTAHSGTSWYIGANVSF
jgi:hypothetical protein